MYLFCIYIGLFIYYNLFVNIFELHCNHVLENEWIYF